MLDVAVRLLMPAIAAAWALRAAPARAGDLPDFDSLWDYRDPAATEGRFREILPNAEASGNADYLAQLLTQIARTWGSRGTSTGRTASSTAWRRR